MCYTARVSSPAGHMTHVLGYGWRSGRPFLKVAPTRPGDSPHIIGVEKHLRFRRVAGQQCIGWRDSETGGQHPCPNRERGAGIQCVQCSRREGWWACMTCDGFACPALAPAMERRCRQTTTLYLASFGTSDIKIGTASDRRRVARLVEQGPLVAGHVAEGPGPLIKQMEALAVRMGFRERFRRSTKSKQYGQETTEAEAMGWLEAGFTKFSQGLDSEYGPYLYDQLRPVELPALARSIRFGGVPVLQLGPGDGVDGRVLGARGHLVLIHDGAGRLAIDLGSLKSGFIDLDPKEAPRAPVRQLGLFD